MILPGIKKSALLVGILLSRLLCAQDSLEFDPERTFPMMDKMELYNLKEADKQPYRLDEKYFFNKKFYFTAKTSEVQVSSYFYMNTKNGFTGYDKDLADQLGDAYSNMDFSIKLDDGNIFMYQTTVKTREKIASIVREGPGFLPQYLEDAQKVDYFKTHLEQTGEKTLSGDKGQYLSSFYQGVDMEGGSLFVLLSDNPGFQMNPDNRLLILSLFGIGYIHLNGSTRLIAGWESHDYISRIDKIEDVNFFFDGKPYMTFQQKADVEIKTQQISVKAGLDHEKKQIEEEERRLNNRAASRTDARYTEMDSKNREIIEVKKLLTAKKETLLNASFSKADEVSKKQGDLETLNKKVHELAGSNDIIEIMLLEAKLDKLNGEKKLINPVASQKDKQEATKKIDCASRRMTLLNTALADFQVIDNKYPEDEYQRYIQKMNIMTTQITPALQTVCK